MSLRKGDHFPFWTKMVRTKIKPVIIDNSEACFTWLVVAGIPGAGPSTCISEVVVRLDTLDCLDPDPLLLLRLLSDLAGDLELSRRWKKLPPCLPALPALPPPPPPPPAVMLLRNDLCGSYFGESENNLDWNGVAK